MKTLYTSILILFIIAEIFIPGFSFTQERNDDNLQAIIDHAEVIRDLNDRTLQEGQVLYNQVCAACHGAAGIASLPEATSFVQDEFKYGADPYSMWQVLTNGAGQMGAQRWLTPEERYAVIQYIREEFLKQDNPEEYFAITDEYLNELPRPADDQPNQMEIVRAGALEGSQAYGQEYFREHLGDYGTAIYSSLADRGNNVLIIDLAENVKLAYDVHRMKIAAIWKGSLDLSRTKYQLYRGGGNPSINGAELWGLDRMQWSYQDRYSQLENLVSNRTPFPDEWMNYHGHYQHGKDVILSYSIIGRNILEMPSVDVLEDEPVIRHTIKIGPGDSWRKLNLLSGSTEEVKGGVFSLEDVTSAEALPEDAWNEPQQSLIVLTLGEDESIEKFSAVGVRGETEGMRWENVESRREQQLSLYIPASDKNRTIHIYRYSGQEMSQLVSFTDYLAGVRNELIPDLESYTQGSDRHWKETVMTQGDTDVGRPRYDPIHYGVDDPLRDEYLVSISEDYPYEVDRIGLPFDNPWNSWIRPSGFDFFEDGRVAMSTHAGDVWVADGIDEHLDEIRWQRIATGLYDPFGVKIVDGQIFVIGRDRLVRLRDLNGDGETDFYESYFADPDVSAVPIQAFNFSLQTDSKGNFLYAKAGQYTNNSEPGNLMRLSPDGKEIESVAIGFRAPNGVTVGPDDEFYVSDNQGTWMPANKISLIREGGFYGFVPTVGSPGEKRYLMRPELAIYPENGKMLPDSFDQPIIWMPQAFDNSPGEGLWTPEDWGPLGDRFLHTSFGKGWVYQVLIDEVDGTSQAAVSALPFQFDSGTQRARVNPVDGQLYVAGITGWDDAFAVKYGSLDRIRYTGGQGFLLDNVKVRSNGIELVFNQRLNKNIASQPEQYEIWQWNYRWQQRYGSADWSVKHPDQMGQDRVPVQGVELSTDGKTVLINISDQDLMPVDQMRIQFDLESEDGRLYQDTIYLTIHKVPGNK